MSNLRTRAHGSMFSHASNDWQDRAAPAVRRSDSGGLSPGLMVAGLAALALGAWAIYHFGPDLQRYIKMERM